MTRAAWIAVGSVSALALGLAVALAVSLASGDEDTARPPDGPGLVTPGGAPGEEFQDCLSEQGVEPPQPGTVRPGPSEGFEEALEACREFLPEHAAPGTGGGLHVAPG